VDTFNTGAIDHEEIETKIRKVFDMRPSKIIETLLLKRPIYKKTAAYGHFGRNESSFSWEKTDKVHLLANK
jgi:S-adenosylmethionine synthetase